jgi:NAD-dependent deacetylase
MYTKVARIIKASQRTVAFTGAGISVESGIPPFRGKNGLWNKYDPATFDIQYFNQYPRQSWEVMQQIFYELFGRVKPNAAHYALARLEQMHLLSCVITQNIDQLHTDAGSLQVHEFHGSLKRLICVDCSQKKDISKIKMDKLPPRCPVCNGILKPDAVFFGETIPEQAFAQSVTAAQQADCMILIGTTGTVMPANTIPKMAKLNGAVIIEINPEASEYTSSVTDIFIKEQAGTAMKKVMKKIDQCI